MLSPKPLGERVHPYLFQLLGAPDLPHLVANLCLCSHIAPSPLASSSSGKDTRLLGSSAHPISVCPHLSIHLSYSYRDLLATSIHRCQGWNFSISLWGHISTHNRRFNNSVKILRKPLVSEGKMCYTQVMGTFRNMRDMCM